MLLDSGDRLEPTIVSIDILDDGLAIVYGSVERIRSESQFYRIKKCPIHSFEIFEVPRIGPSL